MAEEYGEIIIQDATQRAGWVPLPVVLIRCEEVSQGAKLAYGMLQWYGWKEQGYPGHAQLAEDLGVAERSVKRYLGSLEDAGLIEVDRPGLGKTNTYTLPPLGDKFGTSRGTGESLQGGQKSPVPYNDSDSVLDSNEKTKGQFRSSFGNKTELIQHLHDLWDSNSTPLQSRITLLRPWSLEVIQEAAEITARAEPDEPFAYLYGVLRRQPTPPADYETEEPLTDEEFEAARAEIDRIADEMGCD